VEAIKGQHTLAELAKKFEVKQVVISRWKAEFLANMGYVFDKSGESDESAVDTQEFFG
jgi:transposase